MNHDDLHEIRVQAGGRKAGPVVRAQAIPRRSSSGINGPRERGFRESGVDPGWSAYWGAKQRWLDAHPEATAEEVGKAFRKIADDLGL